MRMKQISVIIPVYHNEESLPVLFGELTDVEERLLDLDVKLELIFVDDGSGDNSLKELLQIKQKREETKVIKLTRNFGAYNAIRAGLQFVTGDGFVMLAADLQDPPQLIPDMVEKWLSGTNTLSVKG